MMPKKGRKEITVDDVLYYYKISGCISIVIQNSETNEIIKWSKEFKPKWKTRFGPGDIKDIIEKNNNK